MNVSLPRHPGTYLIVTYNTNGTRLPYYLNNYGSMYLELEYLKQATLMGDLVDPHRGNSSMLCYQHWLRPFNTTTQGERVWCLMFLKNIYYICQLCVKSYIYKTFFHGNFFFLFLLLLFFNIL